MIVHADGQESFLDELDAATPGKPLLGLLDNAGEGKEGEGGFDEILDATQSKPITSELLVTGVAPSSIIAQVTRPITGAFRDEAPAHPDSSCECSRGCKMD